MILLSNATVPLNANALPFSVAPVFSVIDASAMIVPWKTAVVPKVAEVPTCQKMLEVRAPPAKVTCTPLLTVSAEAIWKIQTSLALPVRVKSVVAIASLVNL